jgi:hypothetical protein
MMAGLVLAAYGGCSPAEEVDAYLTDLPSWRTVYPLRPEYQLLDKETYLPTGAVTDRASESSNEQRSELIEGQLQQVKYACTLRHWTLSRNPESIALFNPDADVLWPGSLLQGKSYAAGAGALRELPIRQRAPLRIFVDLLNGKSVETVVAPDAASVHQAIGKIIEQAKQSETGIGGAISFSTKEFSSSTQAGLELAGSAKFMKIAELEADYKSNRTSTQKTVTAYYVQRAYTVSVVAPQTPSALFSQDFTRQQLDEQVQLGRIGPDNLPVYVASVSYGRMLMMNITAEGSTEDISSYVKAGFSLGKLGASGSRAAVFKRIQDTLSIKVAGVGSAASLNDAIKASSVNAYFEEQAKVDGFVPISFVVRNLGDQSLALVSETTNYTVRECQPTNAGDVMISLVSLQLINGGSGTIIAGYGNLMLANKVAWEVSAGSTIRIGDGTTITFDESGRKYGVIPENASYLTRLVDGGPGVRINGVVKDRDSGSGDDTLGMYDIAVRYSSNIRYGELITQQQTHRCSGTFAGNNCSSKLVYRIDKVR